MVALLMLVASNAVATVMLTRGASTLKPLQFVGYVSANYSRTAQKYDTLQEKYVALPGGEQVNTLSADLILGFSPLKNLEVVAIAPVVSKSQGDKSALGLGDASLMLRYGLLGGILPVKLTLAAAMTMPTSAKDAVLKLGDRTTDIAIGAAAQTAKVGPLAVHARLGYWLRGKADGKQFGNMFEYVVFPDLAIGKNASIYPMLAGVLKADNVVSGVKEAASGAGQHSIGIGATWNPIGPLWFKPKATMPLAMISSGGTIPNFGVGLDVWAAIP